eukprot:g9450.t1
MVRPTIGTLLFCTGVFLMMNSDLIVTYFRLHEQVEKFKANNDDYQKNLDKQAQEVRTLQTAAKGFEEIERKFGGSMERAIKEATQTMADIFGAMIKGLRRLIGSWFDPEACGRNERLPKMLEGIRGHKSFLKDKSLSLDAFSKAFEITLFVPDPKQFGNDAVAVATDRPHFQLYQSIDAVLKDLVASPEEDITFIDDPNWDQFPEVGQALKPHSQVEEPIQLSTCSNLGCWGVGVGRTPDARRATAKVAVAAMIALKAAEVGEVPDLSSHPDFAEFVASVQPPI